MERQQLQDSLNTRHRQQVPGLIPNTSAHSSQGDWKWPAWFSQPISAGEHQALCFLKAANVRPSWFLKRTAEARVYGLLKLVTDSLELKEQTRMETIIFGKTHVSSVSFAVLTDKMLQHKDHHWSLFKETRQ